MGEIAEMMVEGILCQQCGVYIEEGEAQGFPRYCSSCKPRSKKVRTDKPKTITTGDNAVRGVKNYLEKQKTDKDKIEDILRKYDNEALTASNVGITEICELIQKDFGAFITWFKENYKKS